MKYVRMNFSANVLGKRIGNPLGMTRFGEQVKGRGSLNMPMIKCHCIYLAVESMGECVT